MIKFAANYLVSETLEFLKNGIVVASDFVRNVGKKTTTEEILDALGRYPTGPAV